MKKNSLVSTSLLLVCMIILFGCGGSGSPGTASEPEISGDITSMSSSEGTAWFDNTTELQTAFSGFTVGNVSIVDDAGKKISGSQIGLNTKFSIVYEGVKNYTLKDGKAFPGLSILVSDPNQNPVINEADLLASYPDGVTEEAASVLRATITVGDPMKPGKYTCSVQVVDKNNNNSSIISTWSFDVK